ncbi:MAG: WD40 repeat domain-containing serine/threonine protein kinase [Thermoguttaceae bacterium]
MGPRSDDETSCASLSQAERADRNCVQFEAAWKAGSRPRFDDFLTEVSPSDWPDLLRELLILDLHYRRQLGECPILDEYRALYPALDFDPLANLFATALQPTPSNLTAATARFTLSDLQAPTGNLPRIRYLGDYELLEEIARGGMGVVYKARQISLNRIVAVKMILAGHLATKADHDRFHAEAQAAALLDHPNILPVFEVGEHEGQHYFSMGYVDGQSLAARLAEGPLPPKQAAELVATVAQAVEYAHRKGVIHRDIKPSNVLIDSKGRPRVTDFGLAKRVGAPGTPGRGSDLTTTGQILGTPSYMAPEQAAGQIDTIGPAADVYALGALLYATLTGRPPFQAATSLETMRQVLESAPVALRQLNPGVPRDLETIVLKCLEKPIPRRYATAQALGEDLRRYLEGRPILARPVGRWEHAWRWCRRQPVVAGLIAAVVLTLVAGTLVSVLSLYRALTAEATARHDLARALLAQARLASKSHLPGQRFETLEALGKASQIEGPSRKLADEAVAALCLADLVVAQQWPGAPQGCYTVAFTPHLDVYARCDVDGNISVRRVVDDREIAAFQTGHRVNDYGGLEFSPDGQYLRATTYDELAGSRLFRIDVTPATTILDDHHIALAFSPDSRRFVALYHGNEYRVCELPSGKELKRFKLPGESDDLSRIYWNPRKPQIAITRPAGWRIADLETGEQQAECPMPGTIGISAWHPDGRHLAVGANNPLGVEIYDTLTCRIVAHRCLGIPQAGVVPTFNHAGDLLVTNDWSGVRRLWDPASGTELLHMVAHDGNFFLVGADDRKAAVSIEGQDLQTLRIAMGAARTFAAAPMKNGEACDYGDRIAPSRDGRILAITSSAGVSLVDSHSGFELAVIPDREPIEFDDSGALLTCGSNGFHRWAMQSKSEGRIVHVKSPESLFNNVPVAAGYSTSQDSSVMSMERALQSGHDRGSYSLSKDGSVVAIATPGCNAGAIVMHQAKAGGEVRRVFAAPQQTEVCRCAVSPDGKWMATGDHSPAFERLTDARVWDTGTGRLVKALPVGALVWVWFSPRGRWLATVSGMDGECRLWRTGSWEAGPRFPNVIDVAFSPDERILALGGKAGQIQLCETESGREIGILPATAGARVSPRCFSSDGTRLYAKLEWDTRVHVWDLRQIRDGLQELGLDQGWPEFPARQPDDDAPPPVVEVEDAASPR